MNEYNPKNGRINVPGTDNLAVTVSPKTDSFYANIEVGIMPVVKALLEKGYHTVSSCGGHFFEGDNREVTLMFPDVCTRYAFWSKVCHFEFLTPSLRDTFFGSPSGLKIHEIETCNELFGTNYDNVYFLILWILPVAEDEYTETLWENPNAYADQVCSNTTKLIHFFEKELPHADRLCG